MITEKDIKYQRYPCLMQPYTSNVFVVSLSFWKRNCPHQTIKNSSISAFGNAVFWKTWMNAKARKCNMKMQYLEDEIGLLLLRDFTVADCSGHEQLYRSLRCHETLFQGEENLLPLVSPINNFTLCNLIPLFPASLYFRLLINCAMTSTDSLKFFKSTLNFLKMCFRIHLSYFPLPCSVSEGRFLFWVVLFSWLPPTCVKAFEDCSFRVEYVVLKLLKKYSSEVCNEKFFSGSSQSIQLWCWHIAWDCSTTACMLNLEISAFHFRTF